MANPSTRLAKELALINRNPIVGCDIKPENNNLLKWVGTIQGPPGTPYEGGIFRVEFIIPPEYPHKPPNLTILTPIYHMNVDAKGKACMDLLRDEAWAPTTRLSEIFEQVLSMLANPNPGHAERVEMAQEYLNDKPKYEKTVREYVVKYAK
jgi:ubiquitin-conjugating enzyme E2 D/E